MSWTIWHNPRCSKSRQTLQLLQAKGIEPDVRLYLSDPPSVDELDGVLSLLGLEPRALMRRKETPFKELNLKDDGLSRAKLVDAMAKNPVLIERPIVIRGDDAAAVGRPPENVLELL
jgi:arsenate reductase